MRPSKTLLLAVAFAALCAAPAARAEDDLALGGEVFQLCAQCHGPEGAGDEAAMAPAIAGMDAWFVEAQLTRFQEGYRGTHFDDISGMRMRPMSLSLMKRDPKTSEWVPRTDEVKAVAAYVATLPRAHPASTLEGGDAARGQTLYAPCTACHAVDGSGNEALGGAPLRNQADWYLVRQLDKFKKGIRGWRGDDTQGAMMRGMVATLPDEQAVKDVVAYISTLGSQAAQAR